MSPEANRAGPPTLPWAGWHLHLSHLGAPATDRVILQVVGPAVDALHQWEPRNPWFFVRYWQFGPHVRFRVGGLTVERQLDLDSLLRAAMTEALTSARPPLTPDEYRQHAAPLATAGEGGPPLETGELWPPGVYRQPYRPEVERYGGPSLLARSESLFQESSELALAFIRRDPPEAARSGLGLRATRAALDALPDDDERRRFCRRAARGWLTWANSDKPGILPTAAPPGLLEGRTPGPVRRWADQLGQAMTLWRSVTPDGDSDRILHAHIHMLHNRLGLSVGQECTHYLALAESLAAVPAGLVAL